MKVACMVLLAGSFFATCAGRADGLFLENEWLGLEFNTNNAAFSILDKRTGRKWEPIPGSEHFVVTEAVGIKNSIHARAVSGGAAYQLTLALNQSDLKIEIAPVEKGEKLRYPLVYPYPFALAPGNAELIIPWHSGFRVSADSPLVANQEFMTWGSWNPRQWSTTGVSMPFFGAIEGDSGFVLIADTAADAAFRTVLQPAGEKMPNTFSIAWQPSKGTLGYTRKALLHFSDQGGYVALAKRYRKYSQDIGRFKSLADKIQDNPEHAKLIGAPQIWIWDTARTPDFIQTMKADGIDKAVICFSVNNGPNHPALKKAPLLPDSVLQMDHPNYNRPGKELCTAAVENGYLWGPYDCYHGYDSPEHPGWIRSLARPKYWEGWRCAIQDRDTYPIGFGGKGLRWCSEFMLEVAMERIFPEVREFGYNQWFYDVSAARSPRECYSKSHPMTRAQDVGNRLETLAYSYQELNLVNGSENGADWAVPFCSYFQGNLTFKGFYGAEAKRKGTPYFRGTWENKIRPEIMVGRSLATDDYLEHGLNEKTRIPLWQLVYGDAAVMTFRWDDSNYKQPNTYEWKNLLCMLYGEVPLWNLTQELYDELKDDLLRDYNEVCKWNAEIKLVELVDHKYLTEDRSVQQSIWANGKSITVNFSKEKPCKFNGMNIRPLGWYSPDFTAAR